MVQKQQQYFPLKSLPCDAFCGCIWDISDVFVCLFYTCLYVWGLTHNRVFIVVKWHWFSSDFRVNWEIGRCLCVFINLVNCCICSWLLHQYLPASHRHVWALFHVLCKCTILRFFMSIYLLPVLWFIYIETLYMYNLHGWRMCNYYSAFTLIFQAKKFRNC